MYQPTFKGFSLLLAFLGTCHTFLLPRAIPNTTTNPTVQGSSVPAKTAPTVTNPQNQNSITSSTTPLGYNQPDHPEWSYLNGQEWWKLDPTQQDHARFHAYLSMAAYGDYKALCPATFTQGFTVLEEFQTDVGQAGFVALIPEMEKVVIVFRSEDNLDLIDWTPVSISDILPDCPNCKAAQGIKSLYLSAREKTNDWKIAKDKITETKLKFSVTGHGVAGAVAALAALDLGRTNWVHYSHNQGMPRALNYDSVVKYDNYFQVLAGQSLIAENDYMVQSIPMGNFYHVGTRVKIIGNLQQYLVNCYGNNENFTCNGNGNDHNIHNTYFTPKGYCGSVNKGW